MEGTQRRETKLEMDGWSETDFECPGPEHIGE